MPTPVAESSAASRGSKSSRKHRRKQDECIKAALLVLLLECT